MKRPSDSNTRFDQYLSGFPLTLNPLPLWGRGEGEGAKIVRVASQVLFGVLMLWMMGVPAWAGSDAGTKFGRGLNNAAFGWFDIVNEMGEQSDAHGPLIGMPAGLVRGLTSGVVRTLAGVYEVVTFPLPNGSKGYEPLIQPASSLSRK